MQRAVQRRPRWHVRDADDSARIESVGKREQRPSEAPAQIAKGPRVMQALQVLQPPRFMHLPLGEQFPLHSQRLRKGVRIEHAASLCAPDSPFQGIIERGQFRPALSLEGGTSEHMYHPTTRLLAVLELLQSRGRIGGGELARRLEVDERTVRRYVTMLRDLGIPVEAELGRYGAYRLRPGYKLPPLMFSNEEALAVVLGLLAARRIGLTVDVTATEGALAKIERVLPEALRAQVQAVSGVLTLDLRNSLQAPASSEIVVALSVGAQESRRVWMRYRSGWSNDAETAREIDPYGVVYRTGKWYCVGYCHLRGEPRVFRLDRVVEASLRDERFERPAGFDSLAFVIHTLATMPREMPLDVLVKTTLEEARGVMAPGAGTLEEVEGGIRLYGTVQDPEWMARYLASLRWPFEVREPPALKDALKRLAATLTTAAR